MHARRRGTSGDKADVPAIELSLTYRVSTLSFSLHSCRSRYSVSRIFLKELFFASESDSSGAGTRMTSALSPGVPRHMKGKARICCGGERKTEIVWERALFGQSFS